MHIINDDQLIKIKKLNLWTKFHSNENNEWHWIQLEFNFKWLNSTTFAKEFVCNGKQYLAQVVE